MRPKTLVTGVIGSDTHIVGNRILSMALEKAGYKVVALGALTPADEFVKAAIETNADGIMVRSEEHTSELQSLMRISYAVFCLKKKITNKHWSALVNLHRQE